jgi:hypothetical protein
MARLDLRSPLQQYVQYTLQQSIPVLLLYLYCSSIQYYTERGISLYFTIIEYTVSREAADLLIPIERRTFWGGKKNSKYKVHTMTIIIIQCYTVLL